MFSKTGLGGREKSSRSVGSEPEPEDAPILLPSPASLSVFGPGGLAEAARSAEDFLGLALARAVATGYAALEHFSPPQRQPERRVQLARALTPGAVAYLRFGPGTVGRRRS